MPSVFKLSLSIKRTRPRTLGGKPAMISTDAGGFGLLWARRTAAPAACSAIRQLPDGAQINPANALAATTAGEPKYTYASRSHMRNHGRQIKFKFDGVVRIRIGAQLASILPPSIDVGVGVAGATLGTARSGAFFTRELANARAQIIHCHFIERKHARQRAPLGG